MTDSTLTKALIQTHVANTLEIEESDISALVPAWVLECQRQILLRNNEWPFLQDVWTLATVADQEVYALSAIDAACGYVREMYVDGDRRIEYMPRVDALRRYMTSDSSEPHFWSEWRDAGVSSVRLYPTPAAIETITVEGYSTPATAWASTTGSPDLPEEFDDLFYSWCVARAYVQQEDTTLAQTHLGFFESTFSALRDRWRSAPKGGLTIMSEGSQVRDDLLIGRRPYSWE